MLKQELKISQRQRLSPVQFQAIRMLGYSTPEMEEVVNKELEANPALEESTEPPSSDDDADSSSAATEQDSSLPTEQDDIDIMEADSFAPDTSQYTIKNNFNTDTDTKPSQGFASEESFEENLSSQLDELEADEQTLRLAKYLIACLDDNGYLTRSLSNIADDLAFSMAIDVDTQQLEAALKLVQQLEPAGVGARDLRECLLLQLRRQHSSPAVDNARIIVEKYFDSFTAKKYGFIRSRLDLEQKDFDKAIEEILHLDPKPGNSLSSRHETVASQVIPDFTVEQYGGNLYVSLNGFNYAKLSVSKVYRDMVEQLSARTSKNADTRQALAFARKKIDDADIFIEAIEQRNRTLTRTMIAIANTQKAFLTSGDPSDLVPMKLKDIAEIVHFDLSTVSRATSNKYVQTAYGIFPLRYFFSDAIKTDEGGEVSNKKIMAIMRQLVESEDKSYPLTDAQIAQKLNDEGYRIARRTIAKYRDEMHIPHSNLRTTNKATR